VRARRGLEPEHAAAERPRGGITVEAKTGELHVIVESHRESVRASDLDGQGVDDVHAASRREVDVQRLRVDVVERIDGQLRDDSPAAALLLGVVESGEVAHEIGLVATVVGLNGAREEEHGVVRVAPDDSADVADAGVLALHSVVHDGPAVRVGIDTVEFVGRAGGEVVEKARGERVGRGCARGAG
jgi:hypothetical protein